MCCGVLQKTNAHRSRTSKVDVDHWHVCRGIHCRWTNLHAAGILVPGELMGRVGLACRPRHHVHCHCTVVEWLRVLWIGGGTASDCDTQASARKCSVHVNPTFGAHGHIDASRIMNEYIVAHIWEDVAKPVRAGHAPCPSPTPADTTHSSFIPSPDPLLVFSGRLNVNVTMDSTNTQPPCTCMSAKTPRRVEGVLGEVYFKMCVFTRETFQTVRVWACNCMDGFGGFSSCMDVWMYGCIAWCA